MKRINSLIVLSILFVCFSCKKDPIDVNSGQIIITESEVPQLNNNNDTISAIFQGRYSYSGKIQMLYLQIGMKSDLSDASIYDAQISGHNFTISVDTMQMDTFYYYRYVVRRYSDEFEKDMDWKDSTKRLTTFDLHLPNVNTREISNITGNSAVCSGEVIDYGSQELVECGVCWGEHSNPTIYDNSCPAENCSMGTFDIPITGLLPATNYYVRAYAKNAVGIRYGNVVEFSTKNLLVTTLEPTNIEGRSVLLEGSVTMRDKFIDNYGFVIGTSLQPEIFLHINIIMGHFSTNNSLQTHPFDYALTNLDYATDYYVRAYVVDNQTEDTIYGEIKTFTTLPAPPIGTIDGLFSVSENEQVYFSKGNLQYQASTNTWRFAENQWDFVGGSYYSGEHIGNVNGSTNNDISSSYTGWIDLFGWGTSGYDHGAECYQPWSISRDTADYHVYGCPTCNLFDESGKADWGYNAISNGGNTEHTWRTLSKDEWKYVFKQRDTPSGTRYAKAQVNAVNGIVILPDNWNNNLYSLHDTNNTNASFETNIIPLSDWTEKLESNGVVFLPAGGERWDIQVHNAGAYGLYWASSNRGSGFVNEISFSNTYFNPDTFGYLFYGRSVRLVRNH